MNNITEMINEENKQKLPSSIETCLRFMDRVLSVLDQIKKDEVFEGNKLISMFAPQTSQDSGYESVSHSEGTKIFSTKDILCLFESVSVKQRVEQSLQVLFQFLCSPKIIYKHSLDAIESCEKIMYRIFKCLEEKYSVSHITSICKVFIDSLWDTFEQEKDLLQLQYILKIYHEFTNFQHLFYPVIEILLDKLLIITARMKQKKFELALIFANNDSYVCNSIVLFLSNLMRETGTEFLPPHLHDKSIEILTNLETTDDFMSIIYLQWKFITNTNNYEKMIIENKRKF